MKDAMKERRSRARQKSFLQGRVYFNNRRSSLDCLVRDFSDYGARLKVSESVVMPEVVELHIPNKDEAYRARVQWRTGDEVGLAFDAPDDSPSIVPGASDLLTRVHRLETEMAALQRKVNELQNELRKRQNSNL
jgi:PilZ domain